MGLELAEVVGQLSALFRFPVEPLAGESLNTALLSSGGLVGDRVHDLRDIRDRQPLAASGWPTLSAYTARYAEDLVAREFERWMRIRNPAGKEYALTDPEWLADLSQAIGRPIALAARDREEHPLRLVSRPTLRLAERTYGTPLEPYRLRANLVVEISEGKAFDEDRWVGRRLRIGDALLVISQFSAECLETAALSTGSSEGDPDLLAGLVKIHGGHLGVTARALEGQRLRTGDPVVLLD